MSCKKWETDIALYAGGDLPAKHLGRTVAHLEACAECRALADDLRAGQILLTELGDEPIEDVAANVRALVLAGLPGLQVEQAGAARRYWIWALAAGLILAAILALPRHSAKQAPVARAYTPSPPVIASAPAAVVNVKRPVMRRHRRAPGTHAVTRAGEPLLVQLVTDDPNIVIYWLVDPKPQGD